MAGLQAVRVLADGDESVTTSERDQLPENPLARKGVPQGRHIHALIEAGRATWEDLFVVYTAWVNFWIVRAPLSVPLYV